MVTAYAGMLHDRWGGGGGGGNKDVGLCEVKIGENKTDKSTTSFGDFDDLSQWQSEMVIFPVYMLSLRAWICHNLSTCKS